MADEKTQEEPDAPKDTPAEGDTSAPEGENRAGEAAEAAKVAASAAAEAGKQAASAAASAAAGAMKKIDVGSLFPTSVRGAKVWLLIGVALALFGTYFERSNSKALTALRADYQQAVSEAAAPLPPLPPLEPIPPSKSEDGYDDKKKAYDDARKSHEEAMKTHMESKAYKTYLTANRQWRYDLKDRQRKAKQEFAEARADLEAAQGNNELMRYRIALLAALLMLVGLGKLLLDGESWERAAAIVTLVIGLLMFMGSF